MGEQVAKDMIAVRIGPEMRMAIVGSPGYFERYPRPQTPQDLAGHNCINVRLPTYGGLFAWGLEQGEREVKVRADGQLVFNSLSMRMLSALDGLGLAYVPEDQVVAVHRRRAADPGAGGLVPVLPRLPPLLPEQAASVTGAHAVAGGSALPALSNAHLQVKRQMKAALPRPQRAALPPRKRGEAKVLGLCAGSSAATAGAGVQTAGSLNI